LRETVEQAIEICAARAHAKGLELICAIDSAVPAKVRSDPTRLRQILINLVGNAIKFTDRARSWCASAALGEDGELRFEVIDTGIGIARTCGPRSSVAFSQADSFTTRNMAARVLGLAICRELATLMGGEIGVQSEVGRLDVLVRGAARAGVEATPTFTRLPRMQPRRLARADRR
jgi:signal transduction histidine kinase